MHSIYRKQQMAHLLGHKTTSGVPNFTPSRLEITDNKIYITTPPQEFDSTPDSETILPFRSIISTTLEIPNNSYCKYISTTFGFGMGIGFGATLGASGASPAATTVGSTIAGGATAGLVYSMCTSRKAILTIQTSRDDHIYSISNYQKDQALHFHRGLKKNL